jgi:hypothetical protein
MDPDIGELSPNVHVPRIVGSSIPRKTSEWSYAAFMLSHFKPFNSSNFLISSGLHVLDAYTQYEFNDFSRKIMSNWEFVHECADERDAECLHKCQQMIKASQAILHAIQSVLGDDSELDIEKASIKSTAKDLQLAVKLCLLQESNWFTTAHIHPHIDLSCVS